MSLLPDEFFPTMVACLNDHGIPATLGPDYTISGGASARAVHKEIREECFREEIGRAHV